MISILLAAFGQGAVGMPLIVNVGIGQTYTSLTNTGGLFDALNTGNFNGASVATIISDITETGLVSLTATFTGSLTIQSNGMMHKLSGTTTANNIPLICISGADNVTFDGGTGKLLTFKNYAVVASALTGPVIQFSSSSLTGVIKNCYIQSNSLSTTIGAITIGAGTNSVNISDCEIRDIPNVIGIPTTMIYSGSTSVCSNTINITNNNIYNWKTYGVNFDKVANGCIISGNSFFMQTELLGILPNYSQTSIYVHAGNNHSITGNFIGGQSAYCGGNVWTNATIGISSPTFSKAIHLESDATSPASIIEGNTIQNMKLTGSGSLYGIHIDGSFVNVKKNKITFNIGASSSSSTIYGVYNQSSTLVNEFSNNMIAIGGGNATSVGNATIYGFNNPYTYSPAVLYYNSINIYGTESGSHSSIAFNHRGTAQLTFKNNILSNIRAGGTGKHYTIACNLTLFTSDYNDFYAIGDALAMWGTTDKADLTAWKAATTMDPNSISIPPGFTSNTDLHILANTYLANIGTPVSVSDDIDGITRSTFNMGVNQIFTTPTSIWTGSLSADWNTPGNWISISKLVPINTDNVIIPNYIIKPVINPTPGKPAVCNNLTIESGAVLTIATGQKLTVAGNLTNNNTAGTVGIIIQSDSKGTGSLITNTALGTGSVEAQRYMTTGAWHMVSSPLSGQTINNFLTSNANIPTSKTATISRGMMDYNPATNNWNSFFTNTTPGSLGTGNGFSMRVGTANAAITFTGTLQAGTQSASGLSPGNWNCIGNPFTSSIGINNLSGSGSTNNFLTVNAANLDDSYGAIYVWAQPDISNGVAGKYTTISNTPTDDAAFDVQQSQAFFVKMNTSTTSVRFTPAMQFHNTVLALKSSNIAWPTIKLIASFNSQKSSTIIAFNSAMTKGLDPTYDAGLLKGGSDLLVYSRLVEDNGIPFTIQALPDNDFSSLIIPIGLDFMTGGEVVFSSELMNLPSDCKVILEDMLTKTFTDLSTTVYKTTIAANSVITDRFRLKTTSTTTGLDKETTAYKLTAYANRNIDIRIIGPVSKNTVATLYDIYGSVILVKKLKDGNMNIIPLPNIKIGIYMLSVNDNGRLNGFKILIRE